MIVQATHFNLCNNSLSVPCFTSKKRWRFKTSNCILPCLVDILRAFCDFQPRKVVGNSVNDSPCLRTQLLVFCHWDHLGNEQPVFAFTCTFYYHAYTHMIPRDGQFFTLFTCRYENPHVICRKFSAGIFNELSSQCERSIVGIMEVALYCTCVHKDKKCERLLRGSHPLWTVRWINK